MVRVIVMDCISFCGRWFASTYNGIAYRDILDGEPRAGLETPPNTWYTPTKFLREAAGCCAHAHDVAENWGLSLTARALGF